MAEKRIMGAIQQVYKNLMQTGEELLNIHNVIDRVAFRDDKGDPSAKETLVKPSEPQNITEELERLNFMSTNILRDAEKLRNRIDKLF